MSTLAKLRPHRQDRHRHRRQPRHRRRDRQAARRARRARHRVQPRRPIASWWSTRSSPLGGSAEAVACHIGELEQIEALFAHVEKKHGRLDILVNNAATNPYFGSILDTDPVASFQKTVDVNIRGYFYMSTHGARLMAGNGGGSIVNVASVNGVVPGLSKASIRSPRPP
jgi:NAD(P)-dependent dehydrogenase (short-subunit alcohol dehydrogenase family)